MDNIQDLNIGALHLNLPVTQPEVSVPGRTESETKDATMRHFNVVLMGDIYAGKYTVCVKILSLTKQADDGEAGAINTHPGYIAYVLDTNGGGSGVRGRPVNFGRGHFKTQTTRVTIIDAPVWAVPEMISVLSQADIGMLVISARKEDFERAYKKSGRTREHVRLAKSLGVTKPLVVVNKMDDPAVNWSIKRYQDIVSKMTPLLKSSGYNVDEDVQFLPISGLHGSNLQERVDKDVCSWWNGACLFEALDTIDIPPHDPKAPLRVPVIDRFPEMRTAVLGKAEFGSAHVKVLAIYRDEDKVRHSGPGENLRVRLSGIEEGDILLGSVLCSVDRPIPAVTSFVAQLHFLDVLENAIYAAGYQAVLHVHSVVEDCEIVELMKKFDSTSMKPLEDKVVFVKKDTTVLCRIQVNNLICVEKYADFPKLGRFILCSEGRIVASGKVMELSSSGSSS